MPRSRNNKPFRVTGRMHGQTFSMIFYVSSLECQTRFLGSRQNGSKSADKFYPCFPISSVFKTNENGTYKRLPLACRNGMIKIAVGLNKLLRSSQRRVLWNNNQINCNIRNKYLGFTTLKKVMEGRRHRKRSKYE
jgi:hypothetical protein